MYKFILGLILVLPLQHVQAGGHALLLIGNMAAQSLEVDGSAYESDRYLAPGLGYLNANHLGGNLSWEAGFSYNQRKLGYENSQLTIPTFQFPLGLRWSISKIALGAGVYYWLGQGNIESTGGTSGPHNDLGYKESGTGAFVQLSYKLSGNSYIEFRNNIGLSNDSDTSGISIKNNDYQIIYGFIFGPGGSESVNIDSEGGGAKIE